jgi:hypothetical protein
MPIHRIDFRPTFPDISGCSQLRLEDLGESEAELRHSHDTRSTLSTMSSTVTAETLISHQWLLNSAELGSGSSTLAMAKRLKPRGEYDVRVAGPPPHTAESSRAISLLIGYISV